MKYYHLSPVSNRKSILSNGLIPKDKMDGLIRYKKRIFLYKDINNPPLDYLPNLNLDIWELHIPKRKIKKDEIALLEDCYYIENEMINPKSIKLIKTIVACSY